MADRAHSTAGADLRMPQPGEPIRPFPTIPNLRPWMEDRLEQLLDEADRLLALLDVLDGDAELEPDSDSEPDADSEPDSDDEPALGWSNRGGQQGYHMLDGYDCEWFA